MVFLVASNGVKFILAELNKLPNNLKSKPIYITNWSYLGPDATPEKEEAAIPRKI